MQSICGLCSAASTLMTEPMVKAPVFPDPFLL